MKSLTMIIFLNDSIYTFFELPMKRYVFLNCTIFTCNLFQSDFSETKQDTLKFILLEIQISSVSVKIKRGQQMG